VGTAVAHLAGMTALFVSFLVMGGLYILFAFVTPPRPLLHFFRVPAIFVFLPDRLVVPVGRVCAGLLLIGVGTYLRLRVGA
jgi:hypothetical protein